MILADFCVLVFASGSSRDMELSSLRVEIEGLDTNSQIDVDSL